MHATESAGFARGTQEFRRLSAATAGMGRDGRRADQRLREQALMSEVPPDPQALTGSMALMAGEFGSVVQP
ncbi:hypothetical protein [Kaistia sp. MMO-174]|uniref:hypothetical protein n=1 Tax=Kaistia sp. MMO-174 TaxID=3081256 RepID=UPI003018776D